MSDPDQKSLGCFTCAAPLNNAGYCNPEVDRLAAQQSSELDPVKRLQIVRQAEKIVLEQDIPMAILDYIPVEYGWWDYMHNVSPASFYNWNNENRMEEVWKEKQ